VNSKQTSIQDSHFTVCRKTPRNAISALVLGLVFLGSLPVLGQSWQRSVDWTVRPAGDLGTTNGNPDADGLGNAVWQYESVPLAQGTGQPTGGTPANPWWGTNMAGATKLTWDTSFLGGAGGWSGGNDTYPLISSNSLTQGLNNTRVPVVRWLNPYPSNITVSVTGVLAMSWSSAGLLQPVDFIMMLQQANGTKTPLVLATRKPASYPDHTYGYTDNPKVVVDLPALQVTAGGSIFYTLRYEDGASQAGTVSLYDTNLVITLKALRAAPLPVNDTAVTDVNESVNVEVLANDQWMSQELPSVTIVNGPVHGTASVQADQSIDYTPTPDYVGTDSLTYQVYDGAMPSNATVTVTINQPYYLYVSPSGNDGNVGTNWAGALATVEGARDKIRTLRGLGTLNGKSVEVVLTNGMYATNHTIQFTSSDSGAGMYPVTYRALNPLQAAISGAQTLTNLSWQAYAPLPGAYVTDVSSAGLTPTQLTNVHTLIVNGARAIRAREPDAGFYTIVSADTNTSLTYSKWNTFVFDDSNGDGQQDIQATWTNLTQVEVVNYARWNQCRMRIASVDAVNHQVHVNGNITSQFADYLGDYGSYRNSAGAQTGATDRTIRYYIENVLQGVDTPGEWYLDAVTKKLYYYPRAGENTNSLTIAMPVVNQLLQLTNVSNLRFDGLVFRDTDWIMPVAGLPNEQEFLFQSTPDGIVLNGSTNVLFANGSVMNMGGSAGIQIQMGASNNAVVNMEFMGNGGGGVHIGGNPDVENGKKSYVSGNRIALNQIHDNNVIWAASPSINVIRNGYNRITGNTVYNATGGGIYVGWFDFDVLAAGHNWICWNTVSNAMTALYDGACLYAIGHQPGTFIMGNRFSDAHWTSNHLQRFGNTLPNGDFTYDGGPINGIYTDETSAGHVIKGNTIFNNLAGIFMHQCRDQIVTGNVLVDNQGFTDAAIYLGNSWSSVDVGTVWISANVLAWTKTTAYPVRIFDGYVWTAPWYAMDWDVFSYGPATFNNAINTGLTYLQNLGREQHAAVTSNPLFVDPANQDYRIKLSAQSLVLGQGFSADWLLETASGPPVISAQPQNQSVLAGQVATFTVGVSGAAPLSYQWFKNSGVIGGATNASYTTPATTTNDNGTQFSVVVSNALDSVTSSNATLTVTTNPVSVIFQADFNGSGSGTGGSSNLVTFGGTGVLFANADVVGKVTNANPFSAGGNYLNVQRLGTINGGHLYIPATFTFASGNNSWLAWADTNMSVANPNIMAARLHAGHDVFFRINNVASGSATDANCFRPVDQITSSGGGSDGLQIFLNGVANGQLRFEFKLPYSYPDAGSPQGFYNLTALNGTVTPNGTKDFSLYGGSVTTGQVYHAGFTINTASNGLTTAKLFLKSGVGVIDTAVDQVAAASFYINAGAMTNAVGQTNAFKNVPWNFGVGWGASTPFDMDYDTVRLWNGDPGQFPGIAPVVAPSPPVFSAVNLVGGNQLVLSGGGGLANGIYYELTSTNVALPLNLWQRIATNQFDGGGNFAVTNPVTAGPGQQFFLLQTP